MLLLPYHMYVRAREKLKREKPEGDRRGGRSLRSPPGLNTVPRKAGVTRGRIRIRLQNFSLVQLDTDSTIV